MAFLKSDTWISFSWEYLLILVAFLEFTYFSSSWLLFTFQFLLNTLLLILCYWFEVLCPNYGWFKVTKFFLLFFFLSLKYISDFKMDLKERPRLGKVKHIFWLRPHRSKVHFKISVFIKFLLLLYWKCCIQRRWTNDNL